ncbi:hypothetical protein BOX15_Mlig008978g1 [Macrostomum lignano]|uniref:PWWP domain-containing protein n=1 Tax=Macrostomum lignano TaxID=282301 RepID=A0A267FIH3_9PLAT|nr:hypothetical protein BOX15_Mlig008978g1 [Macrostomum lignano]
MNESAIGAAITSSQQFDSIFDSAIKAVTSSTTEQLCNNYLKSKPASSAGKLASGLLKGKNANKVIKKAGSAKEEPKQSISRKRKASSLDASSAAESSLPQPPVNFQFASGTWIECSDCKKWRHEPDCAEPCRVPDNWRCSDSADPRQNDCGLPELAEYFYAQGTNFALSNKYVAGSLVWARVQGYPYWPAIVEVDNDYGTFFELEAESNDVAAYHVTFLGRSASRAWVPDARIRPFEGAEDLAGVSAPKPGSAAELELRRLANEAANVVAKLDFQARLERYGYFAGGRVKLVKKKPADVRDSRSGEKKRNKKKLKTAAKADKTVHNNAKSKPPKKKAKQSKPTAKTAAASGELDDVYTDATAVDDVTDLDAGDEQVEAVEDVDLMAARDRFRRRVSQLCEMRSCGEGEGDAGEAHDAADDDEESAEEAEAED